MIRIVISLLAIKKKKKKKKMADDTNASADGASVSVHLYFTNTYIT